jgi:purine-binding chemotaxis protein CheW
MMTIEDYNDALYEFNKDGGELLLFCIDNVLYGVEIQYITEIIGIQPITLIPTVPDYIKGVINIRGKVVPVMSIRNKFNLPEVEYDDKTCIIVVEIDEFVVGLIVDRVREVIAVKPSDICDAPNCKTGSYDDYIHYIIESNDEVKMLLNIYKLVME